MHRQCMSMGAGDEELLLRDIERFKQREQASSVQNRGIDQDIQVSQSGCLAIPCCSS